MRVNKKKFIYLISPNKISEKFFKDLEKMLETGKISFFQLRLKKYSLRYKILIGRKVKQNLRKGQYVQPRHLFRKYSVNEGDPVVIFSKLKNTEVSTGGIAIKSGNIGDILEVKNRRSGKIIKGILKKNKKIYVFF